MGKIHRLKSSGAFDIDLIHLPGRAANACVKGAQDSGTDAPKP